jgi:hypothetical protein
MLVLILMAAVPCSALVQPLSRRGILSSAALSAAVLSTPVLPARAAGEEILGPGFAIRIPPSYYRPKNGRPRTSPYDDTLVVAADYGAGRTASVSRTSAIDLLTDSGEPEALIGALVDLKELGKPMKVASLLSRRRDGDPKGVLLPAARSQVLSATREDNELRFTVRELTFTATSMTQAEPSARLVQARTIFVPSKEGAGAYLVTSWATSAAVDTVCAPTPCECPAGSLTCTCPKPTCEGSSVDATDIAIIDSLRLRS